MNFLKKIISYFLWSMLALIIGLLYAHIILGTNNTSTEGVGYLWHLFYNWGLLTVGLVIGAIISFVFIFLDIFYLKKKLKNTSSAIGIRLLALCVITLIVSTLHYILEKVIDII